MLSGPQDASNAVTLDRYGHLMPGAEGEAAEMLEREPDLDFVTLDFLAEVSMSILAMQIGRAHV